MKEIVSIAAILIFCLPAIAQRPSSDRFSDNESWTVSVNEMQPERREKITKTVESIQSQGGATRSVLGSILLASGQAGLTALVDVAATEIVRLANIRNTQKREWMKMIENECNYTDSLSSVRGMSDFYTETSRLGALDPSNMSFDGISVRGVRDGHEVLFLSCHIDDSRLDHLYQHSKFYLVVDTISFHPYECHLPNLSANGIALKPGEVSERDNGFSYDEREHLTIGLELSLSSSWINEAITVQKNVELGRFKMSVTVPSGTEVYTYSRSGIERNRKLVASGEVPDGCQLDTTFVAVTGDCFVVPRSYMPVNGNDSMWGTGEYTINVKIRESCRFSQDVSRNEKLKHWEQDYRQLKKMQKKGSEFTRYWRTLWEQNGNTLMKTMVKTGLSSGLSQSGLTKSDRK